MSEDFLHFIWKFQYFYHGTLSTTNGLPIKILHPGYHNHHAGPDFTQSKILIDGLEWHGQVEIHIKASDWYKHHHENDASYDSVILHVVWENDRNVKRHADQTIVHTLELKDITDPLLIDSYEEIIASKKPIPCGKMLSSVSRLRKYSMLDRVLVERLLRKANDILELLKRNNNDWEVTTYKLIAHYFGLKVNNEAFVRLVNLVPLKHILQHADQPLQVEAMLFGQSGLLLENFADEHPVRLWKEYQFLGRKYNLIPYEMAPSEWNFGRIRPANFPTVRIAQLSALLAKKTHLFSRMIFSNTLQDLLDIFDIEPSKYWHNHYRFNKEGSVPNHNRIGKSTMINLIINTAIPLMAAYAQYKKQNHFLEKAIEMLEHLPSESNKIVNLWKKEGLNIKNAFDSQASLELYNEYCCHKKCLQCNIGAAILSPHQLV